MSGMKLVGLCGKAGAGKDFTMEYLRESVPGVVRRIAFADGVREECEQFFGTEDSGLFWRKPYDEPIRHVLQWWGTDYRRAQDDLYWVRYGMEKADRMAKEHEENWVRRNVLMSEIGTADLMVVFTDVRFANEAEAIQAAGGKVYEVVAPDRVRAKRLGVTLDVLERQSAHASEVMDFETDGVIENSSNTYPPKALKMSTSVYLGWSS